MSADTSLLDYPKRPAAEIAVGAFRQLLMWPVLLEEGWQPAEDPADSHQSQLTEWVELLAQGGWREREMLPSCGPIAPAGMDDLDGCSPTYEEVVYFHPFIRDLFYGDGAEAPRDRVLRCLFRQDVQEAEVHLLEQDESSAFAFRVPRVEVYLCKPLTAILVVELVWDASLPFNVEQRAARRSNSGPLLSLREVLLLQRRVRQVYPPFFYPDGSPGNSPHRMIFRGPANGKQPGRVIESDFDRSRTAWAQEVHVGAEPPVARHWRELLAPLLPFRKRGDERRTFRQVVDDRIPSMVYLAVDDPRAIELGDVDRLVWCEDGGPARFPFAEDFLKQISQRHVYDRFWRATGDHDQPNLELSTRYLSSGFQFVALGRHGNWFFDKLIQDHWRRHYLRIGLVAHLHRAALLRFADEMGESIKLLKGLSPHQELDDPAFRTRVRSLQVTYLKFLARIWFSEVSNQSQGQELFRWWSDLLGNARLFQEVDLINDEIHSLINDHQMRRLTEQQVLLAVSAFVAGVILGMLPLLTGR